MSEKKKSNKIIFIILGMVIVVLIAIVIFLVLKLNNSKNTTSSKEKSQQTLPVATMDIKNYGTVKIALFPDIAPKTVENFTTLANNGFYDNLTFHRVVKDFVIQGGDKNGDGTGSATLNDLYNNGSNEEYTIEGEFEANGHENSLKHTEGVISMARADYTAYANGNQSLIKAGYNSATCQFFIVTKANSLLDGYYASFGKVIEGMDIIHEIENTPTEENEYGENSKPINVPVIEKIRVETQTISTNNNSISGNNNNSANSSNNNDNNFNSSSSSNNDNSSSNSNNSSNSSKKYIHSAVSGCILVNPSETSESVNYKYKCEYCGTVGKSQYGCYPLSHGGTYKASYTCQSCKRSNTAVITTIEK